MGPGWAFSLSFLVRRSGLWRTACAAILAMDEIPHWDHVDDILTIRGTLEPDGYWDDVSS